jgi:hypothetical protein
MKTIFNIKVIISALVIAGVLVCAILVYILERRPAAELSELPPALAAWTILPAPSSTPQNLPATPTPLPPLFTPSPSAAPGEIGPGVYVQPATGGEGLRIHVAPSLSADLAFPEPAFDSEVFLVTDGPVQAEGYTWWHLTASYDSSRAGWAVQEFLSVIPSQ